MNHTSPEDRNALVWTKVHMVTAGRLSVHIQKSDGIWPRYSLQFMRYMGDGKYAPFFAVRTDRLDGVVSVQPIDMNAFADIVAEAEEWIREDAQKLLTERTNVK